VASLDRLCDGRFLFGIGVGWNVDEMEDHGVDQARRRSCLVAVHVLGPGSS
jgi:alkanesulfonate monooxygenase SsuD/methylene tetrahydromethanopterin reductase-like flavin-dependent oxidoreductase (luciferase family)